MAVFALDKRKKPLMPCSEKWAQLLLERGRAVVQGISYRHCRLLQRADGYGYAFQPKPTQEDATRAA
ncbi:RRXRR domain-containing protein [Ectothiorhodospira shaposhnikovii]|uniref:RRXRR domain-containing protein n=1 Tax=Ectothiorhodospira shaposhnikovii TaxID=1054 RepID=UPI00190685CE|nr:RRXRR domain-containing protein [Ectothiorhodospira shaposhnikovii]